ncbi:MAG: hypothetical protein M1496_01110 [Candidatus Thermoplasmatota archaeon]|jgi:hypothetical protein|nr:hypothetical protein [Candidatus Thermoplasmatota archaeon]
MGKIGVYSRNPRFYYKVIQILRDWEVPFFSIDDPYKITGEITVIISHKDDIRFNERQIFEENALSAVRKSIPKLMGKDNFRKVTIGIDPGPKPGIAAIGDGIVIEAFELPEIEQIGSTVNDIISDYESVQTIIRIGDGDKPNMERILMTLGEQKKLMEVVDESGTSMPHKTHNNALSAARIANIEEFKKNGPVVKNTKRKKIIDMEFTTIKNII